MKNLLLCAAFAGMALLVTGTPASAQLLNPSFESPDASGGDQYGSDNWGAFNQTWTTAAIARTGSQSLKTFGPFFQFGGSGATQRLAAVPGQTWAGGIYAINWSADPIDNVDFAVYKIEFLDAGGALAAGGLAGVDIFESPAWAQAVIVKVDMDGAQGGSIFWDDASLFIDDGTQINDSTWGRLKGLYR
jgi:hypothetical protein